MKVALITGSRFDGAPLGAPEREIVARAAAWADRVIVGDCPSGVDAFVVEECKRTSTPFTKWVADWSTHGKAAGPLRNEEMAQGLSICRERGHETMCFAFPLRSGPSTGTWDCTKRAVRHGHRARVVPL